MKQQTKDKPGTVRQSHGDLAILTTDQDEAPWLVTERGGRRYWASHDEVQSWSVRQPSFPAAG